MVDLDVVLPVWNEGETLRKNVPLLIDFLEKNNFKDYIVIIADNASTDSTPLVSKELEKEYSQIKYRRIEIKGRGNALRTVWSESNAKYLTYMDVDLSTDLKDFSYLVELLKDYDVVCGSRFEKESKIERSFFRTILSRGYLIFLKLLFSTKLRDPQCGFKGITKKALKEISSLINKNSTKWFFDSELLLIAERKGYRIKFIPITWIEDRNSTVRIFKTLFRMIKRASSLKTRMVIGKI